MVAEVGTQTLAARSTWTLPNEDTHNTDTGFGASAEMTRIVDAAVQTEFRSAGVNQLCTVDIGVQTVEIVQRLSSVQSVSISQQSIFCRYS